MKQASQKHAAKLRFALVGSVNTAIDLGILFGLTAYSGVPKEFANIISTTTAFIFSFFANKTFTFKSSIRGVRRQFILFSIVTLFGLWVIQTAIIHFLTPVISEIGNTDIALPTSKLIATIASLVWNYTLYAKVVFKK